LSQITCDNANRVAGAGPVGTMDKLITLFGRQFRLLHERSEEFAAAVPDEVLYYRAADDADPIIKLTVGENILRSAAIVEMTFGGITTRLWDDPFEWTLPEAMPSSVEIIEYLNEVERTRIRGFGFLRSDRDLARSIPAPRELRPIGELLLETLARAEHYQGRAFAIFQSSGGGRLKPR
jgi:hypothetical protein